MYYSKLAFGLLILLGGCATIADEPRPTTSLVQDEHIISTTSSISNTLVLDKQTRFVTCTAPAPDASFNQGAQASITGVVAVGSGSDSGGVSEGEESREIGLGGRSPAVLFTRDLFFRACEFSRNYELSKEEALTIYTATLQASSNAFDAETKAAAESFTKAGESDGELEEDSTPNN